MIAPEPQEVARRMRDAASGAGWPDKIAADIGNAAAWLCAQGADGVTPALAAIAAEPTPVTRAATPDGKGGWTIGPAPAALAGPSALDLALGGFGPVTLTLSDSAMMLLGLAGHASATSGQRITLSGALNAAFHEGHLIHAPHLDPGSRTITLAVSSDGPAAPVTFRRPAPGAAHLEEAGRLAALGPVPAPPGPGTAGTDGD